METTIAAISTAMSASGIGIVRISGEDAMDVISRIYRSKNGKKNIKEVKSHTIHYGYICDGEETVDEVLVMVMRGPKTYTGEDTVEIDCHGGVFAMKKVLETVLKYGAQVAEPGEFTKRAFLNGRLDLSQAEAVMDVIQAKNEYALKSSMSQLKGSVQKTIKEIRSDLIYDCEGKAVTPYIITNNLWDIEGVKQYRFIQEDVKDYTIWLTGDTQKMNLKEILGRIRPYLGEEARIRVELVDEIPVLAS